MTPLAMGWMGTMLAGVRPSIFCASRPTFSSLPVYLSTATMVGSRTCTPLPRTKSSTSLVPISMAMSRSKISIE